MTTLADKLARIAEAVPEFRVSCDICDGQKRVVGSFTVGTVGGIQDLFVSCHRCRGLGYIPRPAHELAETLWKAGWELDISWYKSTPPAIVVWVNNFTVMRSHRAEGTDAYETLADAVILVLEMKV